MRTTSALLVLLSCLFTSTSSQAHESREPAQTQRSEAAKPELTTLLRSALEGVAGTEVIVSRVKLPPGSKLPKHWHPGEEFAYVIEGSVTLWLEGEGERVIHAGEAGKVPLRKVHSASTRDEGATILVFRVHEAGRPERVLVD